MRLLVSFVSRITRISLEMKTSVGGDDDDNEESKTKKEKLCGRNPSKQSTNKMTDTTNL